MSNNAGSSLSRFGCAAVSVALATWFRLLLDPALENQFPFATVFFAVLLTAWYGGFRPALLAVVLGALASSYFILPPRGSFALKSWDQQVGIMLYCCTSLGIAVLGGAMHRARLKAEASAQAERRQAALIDQTYDAVVVWQWNGPITFWNRGAERLYGFLRAEAVGRVKHELLRISTAGGVSSFVSILEREGAWEGELEHTTRDGQSIIVETRMVLVRDADPPFVLEAIRDVTRRRKMEAELRETNDRLETRVRERTEELTQANESLQTSEERFRLLIEGAQDYANFMMDPTGRVLTWNTGAERCKGYRAEEIIGRHFSCFYPEEEVARGKPEQELQEAMTTGRSQDEGWRVRKDRSQFWARVVITPLRDKAGHLRGFAKVTRDITEGMRAQERFRQAVESAPNGMVMINPEGKIVLVNAQTERLFGYDRDELLGQLVELLVPERFRARHPEYRSGFFANPVVRSMGVGRDLYGRRKDGSEFPVEIGLNPIKTDEGLFVLSAIVDITERKRAEDALRDRERMLRIVTGSARVGLVVVGEGYHYLFANEAYAEILGIDTHAIVGRQVWEVLAVAWPQIQPLLDRAFAGERLTYELTVPASPGKHAARFCTVVYEPQTGDDGELTVVVVLMDITERKRAEESLRESEEQFRSMANSMPQLAWMAHADGSIFWYNQRWKDYTGKTSEQMEGSGWQSVHDPDVLPKVLERWGEAIASSQPFEMEFPLRGADGRFRMFLTRVQPMKDSQERVVQWFGTNTDVDELKRMEESLRDTQTRLNSTLAAGAIGTWGWDLVNDRLVADEFTARMFSIERDAAAKGMPAEVYLQAIHEEDRPGVEGALDLAIQSYGHYDIEYRVRQKDREIRWLLARGRCERNVVGNGSTFHGAVMDITDRKRAEDASRESESRYRFLFERNLAGVMMTHEDGTILDANAAAAQIFGVGTRDELLRRRIVEFYFDPTERANLTEAVIREGSVTSREIRFRNADGHPVWVLGNISLLPDGPSGRVFHSSLFDITERKRAEEALRESEQRLRLFIEHAPAALAMFDHGMHYLAASRRWLADHDFPEEGIEGRSHYELFPEITETWKIVHRRGLVGEIVRADEDRFVRADGREQWLRWEVRPWHRAEGSIGGIVIFTEDITDRKRDGDALRRLNADLKRGMQRLAEVNNDLKAKTQENETFVYSVSHDLRSPLVNLQGFSKELDRAAQDLRALLTEGPTPPEVRDRGLRMLDGAMATSVRFILTAVTRLSNIIDALLRLSRAGRVVYQCQRVEVQPIVARVVDSLKMTTVERGATIQIDALPPVMGDPAAVEQVFANLIGNALNYLDGNRPGRIEVGSFPLEPKNPTTDLRTFYVRDNGLGITVAGKAKVFQPFQRLHPRAAPGEGVGLAIVQRVVERLGGKIWFESNAGQGTTFFVAFPVCQDGELPASPVPSTSPESRSPL